MFPLLLLHSALAQEADEEMIITADREQAAWDALDETMRSLGYTPRQRRDGSPLYRPPRAQGWKPKLIASPDGLYDFRSPPVVLKSINPDLSGREETIAGSRMPSIFHISAPFWLVSRRKLDAQESILADTVAGDFREINDAIAARAHKERLDMLLEGVEARWEGSGEAEAKRAELAALWLSRLSSPEGREVRTMLSDFITEVVQYSEEPFTEKELLSVQDTCQCSFP
ncbi:MAG: hypothetical protein ACI8S6_000356 [Myxococcota bacterium]|jgi:hypothetical protein